MKKRTFFTAALGGCLILGMASLAQAEVWIKNFSVEKNGEFVSFKIYASGPFNFTHATEEAKNGKPFRIYLDCQDAQLGLTQSKFFDLPGQTVVGIRTSQYQVSPQKIVRVVLDCSRTVTYKVSSPGDWAEVSIASGTEPAFTKWEAVTGTTQTATTPTQTPALTKETTPSTANAGKTTATAKSLTLPEVTVQTEKTDKTKSTTTPPTKETTSPAQTKTGTTQLTTQTPGQKTEPATPTGTVKSDTKPATTAKTQTVPPETKPPVLTKEGTAGTGTTPQTTPPVLGQSTSTSPDFNKPLVLANQTEAEQWGGFPQRVKVKYSSQGRRDPFSPLFDRIEDYEFGVAPLPALENLKLVGIMQSWGENLALLEDGRGFGYIMQAGDKVKGGRVLRVDDEHVVFQVTEYGWTRNVTLELYTLNK